MGWFRRRSRTWPTSYTVRSELDNTEVTSTCWYCNGTSDTSLAYTGYAGVNCTGSNACFSGTCLPSYCDEDNDTHFSTSVAQCPSGRFQSTAGDDCNDSCSTCYPESTSYTSSPDGLDQDCNSSIDDTACTSPTSGCIPHCSLGGSPASWCLAHTDCIATSAKRGWDSECTIAHTNFTDNTCGWTSTTHIQVWCTPSKYH